MNTCTSLGLSRRSTLSCLGASALAWAAGSAWAQAYPSKAVRIMVGATAGGGTDILARLVAEKFAHSMGQPFVVENKPGAAKNMAAHETAQAVADCTTMLMATNTGQAIAPHMLKLGYDPLKDLQPIGLVVTVPQVLMVGLQESAKTVAELVAAMKARPQGYNYASSGVGSTQHIAGAALNQAAGTQAAHVPYKGSSAAHVDLIGGQVQFMIDTTSSGMAHLKGGRMRALAVTSAQRSSQLPDVPTMAEAGFPSVNITTWYGLYTSGGTPKSAVDKLAAELQRVLQMADVQERLKSLGGDPGQMSLEQFSAFNRSEFESYGKLVAAAGIKAQ